MICRAPIVHSWYNIENRKMYKMKKCTILSKKWGHSEFYSSNMSCRDFSGITGSMDNIMHCTWWSLALQFMIRNIILNMFHNFLNDFFTNWWTSVHLYFWEIPPSLRCLYFIYFVPDHITDLLATNHIIFKIFLHFDTCWCHQFVNELMFFMKWSNVSLSTFANHCIPLTFYTTSQLYDIGVLCYLKSFTLTKQMQFLCTIVVAVFTFH